MLSLYRAMVSLLVILGAAPYKELSAAGGGNHYGWCKGNGNPHGGACASGGTGGSIDANSGHSTPPTATEAPPTSQVVTGTYGQSFTGYGAVPPMPPQLTPAQPPPLAPPPLLPGYVQHPNFTGTRDPATGFPAAVPPQQVTGSYGPSFTGYGPVQTVTGTVGPSFTGYGAVPPMPPQLTPAQPPPLAPPPLLPGYVQHPNFTGTRDPATGFPAAVPPQQVTGSYGPSFTGYGPVQTVTGTVPPPVTGYGPVSQTQTPQPIIQKPSPNPRPTRSNSGADKITVRSAEERQPLAGQMIPRQAGRQLPNAQPEFVIAQTGERWTCAASGLQRRRHVDARGVETVHGALPTLAMVDPLMRDIPAFHEHHSECLIGVQRRAINRN